MSQLARPTSDISFSAGTWLFAPGGTTGFDLFNETLTDNTTTEVASPSTSNATVTYKGNIANNQRGVALQTPRTRTAHVIEASMRSLNAAATGTIRLVENVSGTPTTRATFAVGSVAVAAAHSLYRYALSQGEMDSLVNYGNLSLEVDGAFGGSAGRLAISTLSFQIPDAVGVCRGRYTLDLAGLTALPSSWKFVSITAATPTVPSFSNSVNAASASNVLIYSYLGQDFPADQYAQVRCSASYDNTKSRLGAFIRQNPSWVVFGTDSVRYDDVPNEAAGTPAFELKYDGGASALIDSEPFTSSANLVAGDTHQTRAVGSTISGRKNGVEITTGTDTSITATGYVGVVHSPFSTTPWIGWDYFEAGSVPNVHPALLPRHKSRRHAGMGRR